MRNTGVDIFPVYQPRKKRIGLTALIDVVFILLLFFMLTSSFSQWRTIDINMPVASESSDTDERTPQLLILHNDRHLALYKESFYLTDYRELSPVATQALDKERALVLLTQEEVTVDAISHVLNQLSELGFAKTTLGGLVPEGYTP